MASTISSIDHANASPNSSHALDRILLDALDFVKESFLLASISKRFEQTHSHRSSKGPILVTRPHDLGKGNETPFLGATRPHLSTIFHHDRFGDRAGQPQGA